MDVESRGPLFGAFLTNVPLGTADILSYSMLIVVAIFLVSGPAITYYYWKKSKRVKSVPSTAA